MIRDLLADEHPSFRAAVRADAELTARYRGERDSLGSRADALWHVLRLCWVTDSFFAQVCYRGKVACRERGIPILPALLHRLAVAHGQVCIGDRVVVRPGVYLPHGQVVIDGLTFVDRGAVIRPFVTLGLVDGHPFGPNVGAGAMIGTGAKLVGPVQIGAGAQIGANAVVLTDVPAGRTAVGVPARLVD